MRTQTAFRLEKKLLDLLKQRAKSENRSLNNLVETILKQNVEPNLSEKEIAFMEKWNRSMSGEQIKEKLAEHINNLPWKS